MPEADTATVASGLQAWAMYHRPVGRGGGFVVRRLLQLSSTPITSPRELRAQGLYDEMIDRWRRAVSCVAGYKEVLNARRCDPCKRTSARKAPHLPLPGGVSNTRTRAAMLICRSYNNQLHVIGVENWDSGCHSSSKRSRLSWITILLHPVRSAWPIDFIQPIIP